MQVQPPARFNNYHNAKRQLLGNQAGHAPPAWRTNIVPGGKKAGAASGSAAVDKGSKILLSRLPLDVGDNEVEILFAKTVGPVKEAFIVYNSQGKSKGMAVVVFQRVADAALARTKYNGKIVDGRRPIKIEIIKDDEEAPLASPKSLSLLDRIGKTAASPAPVVKAPKGAAKATPQGQPKQKAALAPTAKPPAPVKRNPKARVRQKKGPKRIQKKVVTVADLDQEMDDYRASAADP